MSHSNKVIVQFDYETAASIHLGAPGTFNLTLESRFPQTSVHVPLDWPPGPGPPPRASLGGPLLGHLGLGGPSTSPTPLFIVVLCPRRCEPLRAGCCGGGGVLDVLQG